MKHDTRIPPLRWIFPPTQLFLCFAILWPMRAMLVDQIKTSLREYGITHAPAAMTTLNPELRPFILDLSDPDVKQSIETVEAREWTVVLLNMPGGLPDMTYAILSPDHSEWVPRGMFFWTWRDLSWPIVGIFFWWLAGRGVEALLFSRRKILQPKIRWWEVAVSLPELVFGAILAVGLCISQSARTEFHFWILFAVLGSMWFVLGASTSLAYFVQWRLRRQLASSTVEQTRTLSSAS